ncbi:glycosyltransferase [Ramlibacter sp. AN1015]|uniref:glycosyltransferase n=1 Tax=Ramlibacter sp. AN1015 TaxID=3133428 RepID=UPI0030BEB273
MLDYFDWFRQKGWRTVVIVARDEYSNELECGAERIGYDIVYAPYSRRPNLRCLLAAILFTARLMRSSTSELHVFHTPVASFIAAIARMFAPGRLCVYYCHGLVSYGQIGIKRMLLYAMERFTCKMADRVIFVSPSLAQYAVRHGYVDAKKVLGYQGSICGVMPNSVKSPREIGSRSSIVLGYFGRICESKGVEHCFGVLDHLRLAGVEVRLIIGGQVEGDGGWFDSRVASYRACVEYLGYVRDKEAFFNSIDLLLCPSSREGFGMSALEANSFGVPVVGFDIVGLRDAVQTGETGFLVEPGSTPALAQAVAAYVGDPAIYFQHSSAALKRTGESFRRDEVLSSQFELISTLRKVKPTG